MRPFPTSRRGVLLGLCAVPVAAALLRPNQHLPEGLLGGLEPWEARAMERVRRNYGREVERLSGERGLPSAYFKALIILESGGRRSPGHRFERHVFDRLKAVRDGQRRQMEGLSTHDLRGAGDAALANLATSWGPLQLMGYHCVSLGVTVNDLRDANALRLSIIWAEETYGSHLRNGHLKHAFHMHNTGRPFPRNGRPTTHAPDYVARGLRYASSFERQMSWA